MNDEDFGEVLGEEKVFKTGDLVYYYSVKTGKRSKDYFKVIAVTDGKYENGTFLPTEPNAYIENVNKVGKFAVPFSRIELVSVVDEEEKAEAALELSDSKNAAKSIRLEALEEVHKLQKVVMFKSSEYAISMSRGDSDFVCKTHEAELKLALKNLYKVMREKIVDDFL